MKYVGIDLHKRSIAVCVIGQDRKVLRQTTLDPAAPDRIVAFFQGLGEFAAALEATGAYDWLWELLKPLASRLALAHPGKLRVIAESRAKSDRSDARTLAEFLALGLLPEAYHPTPRERAHRVLVRHRVRLTQRITAVRCQVRFVLARHALEPRQPFSRAGRETLAGLKLPAEDRFALDELLLEHDFLEARKRTAEKRLAAFAEAAGKVERERRELARSVPGVGTVIGEAVLAELADPTRFASLRQLAAYAGLAPGKRESAGKEKALGISKQGSKLLRWALVQGAWQAVRRSPKWGAAFEGLAKRRGRKRAIVAVARRLLTVIGAVLRTGRPYDAAAGGAAKPAAAKQAEAKPEAAQPAYAKPAVAQAASAQPAAAPPAAAGGAAGGVTAKPAAAKPAAASAAPREAPRRRGRPKAVIRLGDAAEAEDF